jgi:hypothetical protein
MTRNASSRRPSKLEGTYDRLRMLRYINVEVFRKHVLRRIVIPIVVLRRREAFRLIVETSDAIGALLLSARRRCFNSEAIFRTFPGHIIDQIAIQTVLTTARNVVASATVSCLTILNVTPALSAVQAAFNWFQAAQVAKPTMLLGDRHV